MNLFVFRLVIVIVIIIQSVYGRRRVSSRDWPEDQPEYEIINLPKPIWSCTFERDDCGITNDPIIGSYFKLTKGQIRPILGKRYLMLLNITEVKSFSSGARLITPYFETENHLKGCLILDYLIHGNGIKDLVVYQQERENRCVWSASKAMPGNQSPLHTNKTDPSYEKWRKLSLTINLEYGAPRFFIQTHFDNRPPNTGLMAISYLGFYYGQCQTNDVNDCVQQQSDEPEISTEDYANDLP